ncbi:formamidopyrimidine-DNA glycosylase-like isoform X3 [Alnus glutinosa]|uniref:formamidopyrimidine-DNA glycosylase-like isoform X3 n=1 Tax=Alnus glutinosa TaxID=3517 RepID=UPI002D775518|nr:formamidopyrimidine-DNA glycosylase-like isoform X3 [Alnus glutinosa]
MPELPEVEVARRAVEEHCVGKKIKKAVIANDSKVIDEVSPSDFEAALLGKTVISAHRKGRNLWLQLDSPPFPSFQFGMAGAIYINGVAVTKCKRSAVNDTDEWPSKYSKYLIEPAAVPPISGLGPDPLLEPMTVDEFFESLRKKKKFAIKALLLDQSFIAGIGNWIADEVLYQARIHPLQRATSLSKENCADLHKCVKEVIEKAIEVGADSSQFPKNWIYHSREKKSNAFVDGKKIDFINAGGRTTAYVPELQELSGNEAAIAVGKPKKRKSGGNDDSNGGIDEPANKGVKIIENAELKKGPVPRNLGKMPRNKKRKWKKKKMEKATNH